jgi:galactokinase
MSTIEAIKTQFENYYKSSPVLFNSPGRVNLIGEHTDYNNGFVLPASVDKIMHFAVAPNKNGKYRFYAFDLREEYRTPLYEIEKGNVQWANYLLGVIKQFVKDGKQIPGFDCVFGGDVPLGSGMSSSAALECGLAFALNEIFELGYSTIELVKMAQTAEHEYAGVKCGIMDQFAVMHGKRNKVIKLDCESLEYEFFPLDMSNHMLVLVNTGVKHSLASSEYNIRRNECETGVSILQKYDSSITSLRDVSLDLIELHKKEFTEKVYDRCTYVIEENLRLQQACESLQKGDLIDFGKKMYGSHEGLRDKYEVSCTELDQLVEIASSVDGVLGARMMGGGFGGCTINLVKKDKVEQFKHTIKSEYQTPDGAEPEIYDIIIEDGTKQVEQI